MNHSTYRRAGRGDKAMRRVVLETAGLLVLGALLVAAACSGPGVRSVEATKAHRVAAGDTLWDLARSVREPGETTEQAVERIAALNGLDGGELATGAILQLPADDSFTTAQAMR